MTDNDGLVIVGYDGEAGKAEATTLKPANKAEAATVAQWLLSWNDGTFGLLTIIHTRPIKGVPDVEIREAGATHELTLIPLDPMFHPHPARRPTIRMAGPAKLVVQVKLDNDAQAVVLAAGAAEELVREGLLADEVEAWRLYGELIQLTADGMRGMAP